MTKQNNALRLAGLLELAPEDGVEPQTTEDAAAELRRLHAENETLHVERERNLNSIRVCNEIINKKNAELESLTTGYAAARLEIESLQARSVAPAMGYEHQCAIMEDERRASLDAFDPDASLTRTEERLYETAFTNGWDSAMRAAQPVGAQQPGDCGNTPYDEGPFTLAQQPGAAYAALPGLFREALAWGMTYGPEIPAHQWDEMRESMVKQYTERASHGQAPAQAAPAAVAEPPGIQALMCVISSLRDTAHFADEEGEVTNDLRTLRDWAVSQAAAPTTQPAPQQEPSHTAVKLAELVLSDCGHSSNYTPLLDRVAARIDSHTERRLDELRRCLESKPAPQQEAQEPVMWAMWRESTGWLAASCEKTRDECIANCIEAAVSEGLPPDFAATRGWIPRPLYASPTSQVELDAARYRWLRDPRLAAGQGSITVELDDRANGHFSRSIFLTELDAAIDAARAAQKGGA